MPDRETYLLVASICADTIGSAAGSLSLALESDWRESEHERNYELDQYEASSTLAAVAL